MIRYSLTARRLYFHNPLQILKQNVTTWSPLGAAFNSLPNQKLFQLSKKSGLFGIEELAVCEGFDIMKNNAISNCETLLKEACSPDRTRKMVDVFDELSDSLCQVADLAEFIRIAHPKQNFRAYAENASFEISNLVEKLNTNKELYDCLKNVVKNGDKFPLTETDKHVGELFLFDFEQSGIHLPVQERKEVVELNETIINLGQLFMQNANMSNEAPQELVPSNLKYQFFIENGKVIINGFYAESPNEEVRETAYKLFLYPSAEQERILQELLKKRHKLASLCGFPTYVHRAVKGTTAETPEFVETFLNTLNDSLRPKVERDSERLLELKRLENPNAKALYAWDVAYFSNVYKKKFVPLSSNEITSYFCLGTCMEGLNILTQRLFGISLVHEELSPNESWHPNIYKLAAVHETEGLLGHIYCDFYTRTSKINQDCHFTIRGGRQLANGDYQNPVVVLMLNLPLPKWSSPCLLSPGQLDNLAHEMGHALHSMMARTKHQHVTGTRCCTDFAEVPSILMEYFLSDPRVIKTFAKHFQTNEPMSDELIEKLCASKSVLSPIETQTQLLYSALDQKIHGEPLVNLSTTDFFYQIQEKYSILEPVKNISWPLRFSHLIGYGAKYYSYLLSRSVASCIWQTYFKEDPFSRIQGEKYWKECLSHGGGKPPRALLSDFLNQKVSPEGMAETLANDIK